MTQLYFFMLLGSMSVKAVHKTLAKLTSGVNFIKCIRSNISYERRFSSYSLALSKNLYKKTRTYNVDEIDDRRVAYYLNGAKRR